MKCTAGACPTCGNTLPVHASVAKHAVVRAIIMRFWSTTTGCNLSRCAVVACTTASMLDKLPTRAQSTNFRSLDCVGSCFADQTVGNSVVSLWISCKRKVSSRRAGKAHSTCRRCLVRPCSACGTLGRTKIGKRS